jgi:glycerate dehydrogenase
MPLTSTSPQTTNLVVLDGHTLNPGDLDWAPLQQLGNCVIYPRTDAAEIVERARGAAFLLTNKTVIDRAAVERLPQLEYIGVLATGHNVVDGKAAREKGVTVTNVPDYGTASVAQATFALLLELTNHVGHLAGTVRRGAGRRRRTSATGIAHRSNWTARRWVSSGSGVSGGPWGVWGAPSA